MIKLKKILFFTSSLILAFSLTACKSTDYEQANKLYNSSNYEEALVLYEKLEDYKDANDKMLDCKYEIANNYIQNKEYDTALELFVELDTFKNSQTQAIFCQYNIAENYFNSKKYSDALDIYKQIEDYEDSKEKIQFCQREIGMSENADYDFLNAIETSVLNRMKNSDENDFSSLVNTELVYLEEFKTKTFYDKTLKEYAVTYIEGLKLQKEALNEILQCDYQIKWQQGLVQRHGVLVELYNNYNFLSENADFISSYVATYEEHKHMLDGYIAIEADIDKQVAEETVKMEWIEPNAMSMTFKNNTDYTFSTVFEAEIYDSNNVVFETVSAYAENITPNKSYSVTFYISDIDRYYDCIWTNYYTDVK